MTTTIGAFEAPVQPVVVQPAIPALYDFALLAISGILAVIGLLSRRRSSM